MTKNEATPAFAREDRSAADVIERLRDDRARAAKLSPSLCAPLEDEINTRERALAKAREAAKEHEHELGELARAVSRRQAAATRHGTSVEVDPAAARDIVAELELARYLEGARKRRVDAVADAASSAYARAAKDLADRNAAVRFAELVSAAVINGAEVPSETRPSVLAWARLTLPDEGRAAYRREYAVRETHPSYACPRPVAEFDREVEHFWAGIAREREKAAKQAEALGRLTAAAE
jgi:hypothetical protein